MGSVAQTRDGKCIFGIRTMVHIFNFIRLRPSRNVVATAAWGWRRKRRGGERRCILLNTFFSWLRINIHRNALFDSPPFVYAHIRASSEPRINDEYATKCDGTFESFAECWIIVQSQPFAEPMHQVSFAFHTWCGYHGASRLMGNVCRTRAHSHTTFEICVSFSVQFFRCCAEFSNSLLFGFFLTF